MVRVSEWRSFRLWDDAPLPVCDRPFQLLDARGGGVAVCVSGTCRWTHASCSQSSTSLLHVDRVPIMGTRRTLLRVAAAAQRGTQAASLGLKKVPFLPPTSPQPQHFWE